MSTPQTPHTSHLDIDTLADLQEGLLESAQATAIAQHLDGCAQCRARRDALDDVQVLLRDHGAAADVAAPDDVVRRLDDALATAAAPLATASATVTPLTALTTRAHQPWQTRVLQAAAVFVLVAAVGGLGYGGIRALSDGGQPGVHTAASGSKASTERDSATGKYIITNSGRDYTKDSLRTAVPGLLSGTRNYSAQGGTRTTAPNKATTESPTPLAGSSADPKRLRDGTALAECVANLAGGPVTPLAVDLGRFEGKPATIIVLPDQDDPSYVNAYAVEPACPTGTFLAWQHVALP